MVWTPRDDDTIERCRAVIDNSRQYAAGAAMPWFGLCLRMYRVLADNGMLQRIQVEQAICRGCVWEADGGCIQHFEGAHMDGATGEVRFCPRKTTQAMREQQLKLHKRRGRA